ncbi:MAG: CHAT domain-containing protein [Pirellulaceae bacterium]
MHASDEILTQLVGVSQRRDDRGNEGLVYASAPLLGGHRAAPEPSCRPIKPEVLTRRIEDVRGRIEELTWRARLSGLRDQVGIESEAAALASSILPDKGFISIVEPGVHPQFDVVYDAAEAIPWEVLEERYSTCHCRETLVVALQPTGSKLEQLHCQFCGKTMLQAGGKLAVQLHLTHLVRGGQPSRATGNEFLLVEDPTGDLCTREADPRNLCKAHLDDLKALLQTAGYSVSVLKTKNATTRRLLAAIAKPTVIGLYYFGHGFFPLGGDQGCLLMADGPLYAGEIEQVNPGIRFVFLNACEGGAAGQGWTLERRFRSVGSAFARGGPGKVVIAPLWPVVNFQAAEFAMTTFRGALGGERLGTALHEARRTSLQRYEAGAADVSWMAYRFFGDPNRGMPAPKEVASTSVAAASPYTPRLFDENGKLNTDLFGFDISGVLLRAAKRRGLQQRALVTTTDFLAGLIRVGDLTRFALRSLEFNPDHAYEQILKDRTADHTTPEHQMDEASHSADDGAAGRDRISRLRQLLAMWIVRDQGQFDSRLVTLASKADEAAQRRGPQHDDRISEHDLLAAFIASGQLEAEVNVTLPKAKALQCWLDQRERHRVVDANGRLLLIPLTPMARRIVESAHELAEQRGVGAIPNRLMLASFLNEEDSHAASVCRSMGTNPEAVAALMIAGTESRSPSSFVLSPESGQRVVIPMLRRARELQQQSGQNVINEATLFKAYCDVAPAEFKALLRQLPDTVMVDLDQLRMMDQPVLTNNTTPSPNTGGRGRTNSKPSRPTRETQPNAEREATTLSLDMHQFDATVRKAIATSRECARLQGYREIRSVHLFTGWVSLGTALVSRALNGQGVRPEQLCLSMLRVVPPRAEASSADQVTVSENTGQILKRALDLAKQHGAAVAGEQELCRALLADRSGIVCQALIEMGLEELVNSQFGAEGAAGTKQSTTSPNSSVLSLLTSNLTDTTRRGQSIRAIGRNSEIGALVRAVATREANVLLVGERGVGKTAVVEGVADWIADGLCPDRLSGYQVVEVSGRGLAETTRFSGDVLARLQRIMAEIPDNTILFFDDLDALLSATQAGGDAANQGALDRLFLDDSNVKIATMTGDAFANGSVANSRWLESFQVQRVEPPSRDEAIEMLAVHRESLEQRYGVTLGNEALEQAVDLSGECRARKALPGSAIDLLHVAGRPPTGLNTLSHGRI